MRAHLTLSIFFFLLLSTISSSQTTNISGVINSYTSVSGIYCNSVDVNSTTGFSIGSRVMLIQMKGVTVNQTNTPSFGAIINYNNCGNYEMATIDSISGNTIYFINAILRTYSINDLVQLISVPNYTNVNVIAPLTCLSWNGSTGGVLAFEASGNVNLNAAINASGCGFKGGAIFNGSYQCTGDTSDYLLS